MPLAAYATLKLSLSLSYLTLLNEVTQVSDIMGMGSTSIATGRACLSQSYVFLLALTR